MSDMQISDSSEESTSNERVVSSIFSPAGIVAPVSENPTTIPDPELDETENPASSAAPPDTSAKVNDKELA